jgi:hypothetical protein
MSAKNRTCLESDYFCDRAKIGIREGADCET